MQAHCNILSYPELKTQILKSKKFQDLVFENTHPDNRKEIIQKLPETIPHDSIHLSNFPALRLTIHQYYKLLNYIIYNDISLHDFYDQLYNKLLTISNIAIIKDALLTAFRNNKIQLIEYIELVKFFEDMDTLRDFVGSKVNIEDHEVKHDTETVQSDHQLLHKCLLQYSRQAGLRDFFQNETKNTINDPLPETNNPKVLIQFINDHAELLRIKLPKFSQELVAERIAFFNDFKPNQLRSTQKWTPIKKSHPSDSKEIQDIVEQADYDKIRGQVSAFLDNELRNANRYREPQKYFLKLQQSCEKMVGLLNDHSEKDMFLLAFLHETLFNIYTKEADFDFSLTWLCREICDIFHHVAVKAHKDAAKNVFAVLMHMIDPTHEESLFTKFLGKISKYDDPHSISS